LSGKTLGSRVLAVDYFGTKSTLAVKRKPFGADQLDPFTLFVSRYPLDTTTEQLQELFPTAWSLELPIKKDGQPIG